MSSQNDENSISNYPRQHHYIPKFYLEGFTISGSQDNYLWVLDIQSGKQWKARPENVAHQRDFYRIELPGVKPDIFENALSKIESQASVILKNIVSSEALPDKENEDFINLINLVALMTARVPRVRSVFSGFVEDINKFMLKMTLATPEHWESTKESMKKSGYELGEKINYEQMKRFIESDKYQIEVNKLWHLNNIVDIMDILIPLLMARNWSLLIAEPEDKFFICSDSPVSLMWTKPAPAFWGPGFGMPDTELLMPLNKKQALVARFEGKPKTYPAPLEIIAKANNITRIFTQRFIYSPEEDFVWLKKDGKIGSKGDLIQEISTKESLKKTG